jgi:hypothetical protein
MTDFEDKLRDALRPGDVPAGFAHRVLAKVPEAYPPPPRLGYRRVAVWAAGLVIAVGAISGVQWEHAREKRVRGEEARQKVMLALRITSEKLNKAQSHVLDIGSVEKGSGER